MKDVQHVGNAGGRATQPRRVHAAVLMLLAAESVIGLAWALWLGLAAYAVFSAPTGAEPTAGGFFAPLLMLLAAGYAAMSLAPGLLVAVNRQVRVWLYAALIAQALLVGFSLMFVLVYLATEPNRWLLLMLAMLALQVVTSVVLLTKTFGPQRSLST